MGQPVLTDYSNSPDYRSMKTILIGKTREFIRYAGQLSQGEFFVGQPIFTPAWILWQFSRSPRIYVLIWWKIPRSQKSHGIALESLGSGL